MVADVDDDVVVVVDDVADVEVVALVDVDVVTVDTEVSAQVEESASADVVTRPAVTPGKMIAAQMKMEAMRRTGEGRL